MNANLTVLAITITLGGCAGAYTAPDANAGSAEPIPKPVSAMCDAQAVQEHIGREATQAAGEAVLDQSGARTLRWGPPNSAWTMDYREDRVNIRYDDQMKITAITCG
ncbi:I78 family peptidase inhibitor [Erythrobacter ani]|uniref:Peptidase inhibitor I78 family protein n=1 Tax=Erythrobacter ani TaxID=2827235 RepID=A0ABS6SM48_9SPHN|nr:I78 family peptidase inhibitor [Erythrobacter ani]MBV7266110.1 hypothetical protein [Erythrobacter ani]